MDDEIESLLIAVRADTSGFDRDVSAMRASLADGLGSGAGTAGRAIETALAKAVTSGKTGFGDLKATALRALEEIAAAALKGGIASLFGTGGGSGSGGGLVGVASGLLGGLLGLPGRATGGPVSPGAAYFVGERGPELFVPTASGSIATIGPAGGGVASPVTASGVGQSGSERTAPTPAAAIPPGAGRDVRVAISINTGGGDGPQALARSSRQVARAVARALSAAEG